MNDISLFCCRYSTVIIWSLRLIIGATFIISGLSKSIDLWGFSYKIEQYLNVWNIAIPSSFVVLLSAIISFVEFIFGIFLATGSYKRTSAWMLTAMMAVMLPLSIYIAIANPVDDCGCFGDLWVISNNATCVKNICLTVGLIYLLIFNKKIAGIFHPSLQWLQCAITMAYILVIGLTGYKVQPLIDFRSYKEGHRLLNDNSGIDGTPAFRYVYEKNGAKKEFDENCLPDSSWTFIDRVSLKNTVDATSSALTIYDKEDNDVTEAVICQTGEQLILLIPDIKRVDISNTYIINELSNHIKSKGGTMIGIIASDDDGIAAWKDISMAGYPIYTAEDTAIKEFARGNISIVYMRDGIIRWKRTVSSIDVSNLSKKDDELLSLLYTNGKQQFIMLTIIYLLLLLILPLIDRCRLIISRFFMSK